MYFKFNEPKFGYQFYMSSVFDLTLTQYKKKRLQDDI